MESVRRSLFSALGHVSQLEKTNCVNKQAEEYRQEAHRLWERREETEMPAGTTVEDLVAVITSPALKPTWFNMTQRGLACLDSSACAALLKELCRRGHSAEAFQIFDWLRSLDASHELTRLLDVYTYTTMIAQCGTAERLSRAGELMQEMRQRGVQCNVHTYTALMHVYAKTDQTDLALGVPELMKKDGCTPNLVTFNTLINLFRKMGEWKRAVDIIDLIDDLNIQAEAKTYNSVIGACSSSGEPAQALYVYRRMLAKNVKPSATTYTALISAHGKKGLIEEALAIFSDMVQRGCERNVITYSSLIGACEKTGQWELAFELFRRMKSEGIQPNIITFNSMITTCASSAKWAQACEVYNYMIQDGCRPDPTTYLTLLGALMKGRGQWTAALSIAEDMPRHGYSRPDQTIYNALMEILWISGDTSAQTKALQLWRTAQENGIIKCRPTTSIQTIYAIIAVCRFAVQLQGREFTVEVFTCAAAVITVLMWLKKIKTYGLDADDISLAIRCGRRSAIEQSVSEIQSAITGVLTGLKAPFSVVWNSDQTIHITSTVGDKKRTEWFCGEDCRGMMCILEEATSLPPLTSALLVEPARTRANRCAAAYRSVLDFEVHHKIYYPELLIDLPFDRSSIVQSALSYARSLGFKQETALDAVWLFDRIVACGEFTTQYVQEKLSIIVCVCVLSIGTATEKPAAATGLQDQGFGLEEMVSVKAQIQQALLHDLCALSPLRILSLFGELLGSFAPLGLFLKDERNVMSSVIIRIAQHPICVQFPSSLLACLVFYEIRRVLDIHPYWPTEMQRLTGNTPESIESTLQHHAVVTDIISKLLPCLVQKTISFS